MTDFKARINIHSKDQEIYLYMFGPEGSGRHVAIVADLSTEPSDEGPQDPVVCVLYDDRKSGAATASEVHTPAQWYEHMKKIKAFLEGNEENNG